MTLSGHKVSRLWQGTLPPRHKSKGVFKRHCLAGCVYIFRSLSRGERLTLQDLGEGLKGNHGLVVGDFVAGLVYPQEIEVSNRLELPIRSAVDSVLGEGFRLELGAIGVVEVVDD